MKFTNEEFDLFQLDVLLKYTRGCNYSFLTEEQVKKMRQIMKKILKTLYNPNIQNEIGLVLHVLVAYGDSQLIQFFIDTYDPNLDIKNKHGDSPLHFAVMTGNEKITKLLVKNHSDYSALNSIGQTPIQIAALRGNDELVRFFLKKTNGYSENVIIATQKQISNLIRSTESKLKELSQKPKENKIKILNETARLRGYQAVQKELNKKINKINGTKRRNFQTRLSRK